jgi:hypothetical protein
MLRRSTTHVISMNRLQGHGWGVPFADTLAMALRLYACIPPPTCAGAFQHLGRQAPGGWVACAGPRGAVRQHDAGMGLYCHVGVLRAGPRGRSQIEPGAD